MCLLLTGISQMEPPETCARAHGGFIPQIRKTKPRNPPYNGDPKYPLTQTGPIQALITGYSDRSESFQPGANGKFAVPKALPQRWGCFEPVQSVQLAEGIPAVQPKQQACNLAGAFHLEKGLVRIEIVGVTIAPQGLIPRPLQEQPNQPARKVTQINSP